MSGFVTKWGNRVVIKRVESTTRNLVKEKRLVFLSAERLLYTDKNGVKQELSLDGMAQVIIDKMGYQDKLISQFGINKENIKDTLVKAYNKGGA